MPSTSTGWVSDTLGRWLTRVRETADARPTGPYDYDGTHEEAWSYTIASMAYLVDQGAQILVQGLDLMQATGQQFWALAYRLGIRQRPATSSRYTFRCLAASGTVTLPAGTEVEGGGDDGRARWRVVEDTSITTSETQVLFDAVETGAVAMDTGGPTTLRIITPVSGFDSVAYDPSDGDDFALGKAAESESEGRARLQRARAAVATASPPGVRGAVLALPWVAACSPARPAAGQITVTVHPAPSGSDQQTALATAIYQSVAEGVEYVGTESLAITGADGRSVTVKWSEASTETVAVVATLATASGVTVASVTTEVEEAIRAVFATLDVGDTLYFAAVYCAIVEVSGVTGVTLTLAGGTADVTPASTDLVVVGTITVS